MWGSCGIFQLITTHTIPDPSKTEASPLCSRHAADPAGLCALWIMASKMNLGSWGWKVAFSLALYSLISSLTSFYLPSSSTHFFPLRNRQTDTDQWNLCPSQVKVCMPVVPATWEAEAAKSPEFRVWVQSGPVRVNLSKRDKETKWNKHQTSMFQSMALFFNLPVSLGLKIQWIFSLLDHLSVLWLPRFDILLL
jgi:hypothetical protein